MSQNVRLTQEQAKYVCEVVGAWLEAKGTDWPTKADQRKYGELQAVYDDMLAVAEGRTR